MLSGSAEVVYTAYAVHFCVGEVPRLRGKQKIYDDLKLGRPISVVGARGGVVSRNGDRNQIAEHELVIASLDCTIEHATGSARRWLRQFFGRPARRGLLPRKVCRWLSTTKQQGRHAVIGEAHGAHLFVREIKLQYKEAVALELEMIRDVHVRTPRTHRGLTRREDQVLHWLQHAKSDAEIGQILDIAPSTVGKHLERIFPKLGVE